MNVGKLTNEEARVIVALRALRRARAGYVVAIVDGDAARARAADEIRQKRDALRTSLDDATGFLL